ncbi:MAG: shikimate kinase [Phycisphaerae bacterium]|nr:shikimate kinase [Phycisphaerae bacterium]
MAARNVILIGLRGSGKSSVGRALAARLGWEFVDTDERVEAQTRRTIAEIFAQDGEPAFRALETAVIKDVARGTRQVLSVGGGAVLNPENCASLRAAGVCVWLTAPAEELHRRTQADPGTATRRPALTDAAGVGEVRRLLSARQPLYAALADHVVSTEELPLERVVETVLRVVTSEVS